MIVSAAARRNWVWWVLMGVVSVVLLVWAGSSTPEAGTGDERLFALAGQLKCLQCVGESVAASQAPLAQQFRDEIREQMDSGATDDEILVFFAQRYGDEVLLEPPSRGVGALVWVLPVLLVGGLVVGLVIAFGRWRGESGETGDSGTAGESGEPVPTPRRSWRTPVTVAGVGVVVVLAIVALTRGTGERGEGEMTGGTGTLREELARCQPLAMRQPEEAIPCYDAILEREPDNSEALTYRGWANIRAGNITEGGDDLTRAVELDPDYPDARVFRAIVAADAGDFSTASQELTVFFANDPSAIATQIVASEGLERKIFFGLMDPATRTCWQQAAGDGGDGAIDQAFLDALGTCLDGVLAADGSNRDARLSKALATYGYEGTGAGDAQTWIDGLLAEDPSDVDALSLQVTVDLATGDLEGAQAGIDRLRDLPRAPAAFLIGDPDGLQAALDAARQAEVPNPDGG